MKSIFPFYIILFSMIFAGCYTFTGISIPPDVNTFFVETFENQANNSPPALQETFTEALKNKIRNESRLVLKEVDPDITFTGTITNYDVTFEAPEPGEQTAFSRLTITVNVDFINEKNEDENWQSRFSFFTNFSNDENLDDIQEELISAINDQLVEDIFNKAFTNW